MATLNLDEILNYINPEPRYAGKLKDLGLLGAGDLKAARKQSIFQGLLGAGLGYLAQPKNQKYGSILPYFAKAGMQGLQAMKSPYEQLTKDALMNQKLKEVEYQRGERKYQDDQRVLAAEKLARENEISKMPLFNTTLTNRPNLPIGPKQLTLPSGEQSVRPMFGTTPQSPTVSQEINIDKLNRLAGNQSYPALTANLGLAESINKLQNPELDTVVIDGKLVVKDKFGNIKSTTQVADPKIKDPQSQSFQNVYNEVTQKTQKWQVPKGALADDKNGDGIPDNWIAIGDPYSSTDTRDISSASMTNIKAVLGRIENKELGFTPEGTINKFNIANDIASVAEEIGRVNQLKGTPINDAAKTNQAIELFKKSGALIEGSFIGDNESYDSNKFTSYVESQLTGGTKESTGITTLPNGNVLIKGKGERDGEYQILPNGTYKKVN
jgi:hypothetical protein